MNRMQPLSQTLARRDHAEVYREHQELDSPKVESSPLAWGHSDDQIVQMHYKDNLKNVRNRLAFDRAIQALWRFTKPRKKGKNETTKKNEYEVLQPLALQIVHAIYPVVREKPSDKTTGAFPATAHKICNFIRYTFDTKFSHCGVFRIIKTSPDDTSNDCCLFTAPGASLNYPYILEEKGAENAYKNTVARVETHNTITKSYDRFFAEKTSITELFAIVLSKSITFENLQFQVQSLAKKLPVLNSEDIPNTKTTPEELEKKQREKAEEEKNIENTQKVLEELEAFEERLQKQAKENKASYEEKQNRNFEAALERIYNMLQ